MYGTWFSCTRHYNNYINWMEGLGSRAIPTLLFIPREPEALFLGAEKCALSQSHYYYHIFFLVLGDMQKNIASTPKWF